jgi:hypothetical protein
VQFALQDLSWPCAPARRGLDAGVSSPWPSIVHFHVDAALWVQHRHAARAAGCTALLATVPGNAKAVATPMAPVTACDAWQRFGVK